LPSLTVDPSPPWYIGDQVLLIASGFPPNSTVYFLLDHPSRRLMIGSSTANESGYAFFVYTIPTSEQGYPITYCTTIGFLAYEASVGGTNIVYGHVEIHPPDFRITSWTVPLYVPPGSTATIKYTVTNQGYTGTETLTVRDETRGVVIRQEDLYLDRMASKSYTESVTMPNTDLIIKITIYEPVYKKVTDEKTFTISYKKLKSKIDLSVNVDGNVVNIRGRLYDPVNGWGLALRDVKIYENDVLIGTVKTDSGGYFSMSLTRSPGTYTYYAEWDGDDTYEGCE